MVDEEVRIMLATVGESIARVHELAGDPPDRAVTRVLALLWSAYDELEMHRWDAGRGIRAER